MMKTLWNIDVIERLRLQMDQKVISVSSLVENKIPNYFYETIRKEKRYQRPKFIFC